MPYIGKEPIVGNFQRCDAITVVNGQAAYTLQVSSTNVVPESENHILVSLNGILQAPGAANSFTVSGSTLTFVSNLATGDVIDFVILLGNVLDLGVPSDDTVGAAQIKADLISGTTALASEPADTDEFLVSDAGTLKRIDYSLIKGAGKVLQHKEVSSSAVATGTTVFVEDDTIPQNDEGTEIMTLAITPVSATSTMYIATQIFHSNGATTRTGIGLFKDSDANALAFTSVFIKDPTSMGNGVLRYAEVTGNTTARTYKVRIGGMGSSTITFNGQSTVRKFGGIDTLSSIQILEVEA